MSLERFFNCLCKLIWKIFKYIPLRPFIIELKKIINRINNFEKSKTYLNSRYSVKFENSKELIYFTVNIDNNNVHSYTRYFNLNKSQAILLCLDKYAPVNKGFFFDRRWSLLCSKF